MWQITVNSQNIDISADDLFIRGSVGVKINVILTEYWNDYITTLVFYRQNRRPINIILQKSDNIVTVPYEILAESGSFKIGAFGIKNDIVSPTLWSDEIKVRYGTDTHGTEPTDYTPDEIHQIKALLNDKQDTLTAGENITINNNVISATGGSTATSEKWEKIVDFTVEEDCVSVKIDTDLNGEPFELKRALVIFELYPPLTGTVTSPNTRLSLDKSESNVYADGAFLLNNIPSTTETKRIVTYLVEKIDGYGVVMTEARYSRNGTNVYNSLMNDSTQAKTVSQYDTVEQNQNINSINASSYTIAFAANSKIVMYGIRE